MKWHDVTYCSTLSHETHRYGYKFIMRTALLRYETLYRRLSLLKTTTGSLARVESYLLDLCDPSYSLIIRSDDYFKLRSIFVKKNRAISTYYNDLGSLL